MADGPWIAVGRIRRTRGRRGELLAEIYSARPGRAEQFHQVALERGDRRVVTHVEQVWFHDGRPVFKFAGIDSISAAEPWEGSDLLIPQSQRLTLEEGEYTHADLIGCAVQQDARVVGVVKGIAEYGGPVVLEIQAQDGREILVPFAREICREIDVANKRILVQLPEGLSDL